jgi:hypothetical protein
MTSYGAPTRDYTDLTWVFQGTVAEDATAGTHNVSLTITPGTGNELELIYGSLGVGAGAGQTVDIFIDDGTNLLTEFVRAFAAASGDFLSFPSQAATNAAKQPLGGGGKYIVSGTMRLKILIVTATISLTDTFAVVCRVKGAVPTATLADTVGTPVVTTNTNKVF